MPQSGKRGGTRLAPPPQKKNSPLKKTGKILYILLVILSAIIVGGYAAALIDQAGLKGYQVGGAAISTKHAGFAVNLGGATARDVQDLLKQVSDIVYAKSGIRLEPEVRIW